jgi:hypothetical protein
MAPVLPAGPYEQIDLGNGTKAPLYLVPFDKDGLCTAPQTRQALVAAAKDGGFTDVFVFSHGWNNDWPTATERYRDFFAAFRKAREAHGGVVDGYRPLLVGLFWPSTALAFGNEKAPSLAGGPIAADGPDDEAVRTLVESIDEIARQLEPSRRERFYELASAEALGAAEAEELAALLLPLYSQGGDPEDGASDLDAASLVALWRELPDESDDEEDEPVAKPGMVGVGGAGAAAGPQAAGGVIGTLIGLPRQAVRGFTVWQMKDRAGVVGKGVSPLLRDLLAAGAGLHLIGHSYGCKVLLSAICEGPALAKGAVASLLLLQPAINFWCFAADVDGEGFPGGYRDALRAVRQPILQTWSKHDIPLRRMFHLAVTRSKKDLGEPLKAAGLIEPDRYGALGGWGPRGCAADEYHAISMPRAGEKYPDLAAAEPRIYGLNGGDNDLVNGHGDVVTAHTAWALLQQVRLRP